MGGLWPCLLDVGLIVSGVYCFVDRDRWSAWRMTWHKLLPRVLSLPGTRRQSLKGRKNTFSPDP